MKSLAHYLKDWKIPALLIIGSFLAAILLRHTGPAQQLELKITDQLFKLRGPLTIQDSTVVLVSISQSADAEIPYKYPWPTYFYAKLIENLNKAGAKAIGFDVIFDKHDLYDLKNDSLFARALKKYGNVVLAGNINSLLQNRGDGSRSVTHSLVQANEILTNMNPNPPGMVNTIRDADSEIRQYPLYSMYDHHRYYSLVLELLRIYNGWQQPNIEENGNQLTFGSYTIPKSGERSLKINYVGGPSSFPTHSFDMVIDDTTITLVSEQKAFPANSFSNPDYGLLANEVFKDKIVLVGATMPTLNDFYSTPFTDNGLLAGYEIHANALQTILTGNYLYHMNNWVRLIILLLLSAVVVIVIQKSSGRVAFIQFGLLVLVILGIVWAGFLYFNYVIPTIGPLLAVFTGYLSMISYNYITEQKEKYRIRSLFSTYLSPPVVDAMIKSDTDPQLGGNEQNITALFSDIESFTQFSEQMKPRELVELLNEYLSVMTHMITEHAGTLDKYIGDAIVAFFGAPITYQKHAYKACVVSQLMQSELSKLREKWKGEGEKWPEPVQNMRMRIGINSGNMLTGNMGSESRFNYTIMGDNVNLAARCESAAKHYGVYTLVTEYTKNQAEQYGDRCVFRYLDHVKVKGRTQPLHIYELMGLRDFLSPDEWACKRAFEAGILKYQHRRWDDASLLFEKSEALEKVAGKGPLGRINPSIVYLKRCKRMKKNPPPNGWNAVFKMASK